MAKSLQEAPRTSFRLPFGLSFSDPLKADQYDSENLVIGRTSLASEPSAIYLGKLAEFEQMRRNVWLDCHGAHAVYIVGKRRSGKSYTLGVVCEGLVSDSWLRLGQPEQAVLLLDTLNIYGTFHVAAAEGAGGSNDRALWQLPNHVARVRYVAPEVTRPMIAAESTRLTVDPTWLTLEDWCGFFDIDPFADPLGHLLAVVLEAARQRWNDASTRSAGNDSGISEMVDAIDHHPDAGPFEDSTKDALRRRLRAVERLSFLSRGAPSVETLLTAGMITVCQLRDLDDRLRALIVAVLIREIMRSRARADATSRLAAARAGLQSDASESAVPVGGGLPRCWIAIDEAHNYLPSSGSLPSRPVIRRLITEGRNIGLSVIVATQQPSGLDSSIQRNADALLVHSMSMRDDIAAAEGMLNALVPESATWGTSERAAGRVFEKVVRALPQGYCLVSTDTANRVFGLRLRPRLTMHGGESY